MAKQIITQTIITDDFDGKEIQEGLAESLTFSFENTDYRIDLRPENSAKLRKDLEKWIAAAEKVTTTGRRGRPKGSGGSRPATGSGRSKEELAAVRDWAKQNGHEVSERGRIAAPILDAYDEAHKPGAKKTADKGEKAEAAAS